MNRNTTKQIDHIGIAVKDLNESIKFYTTLLGLEFLGYETVESEKVKVAFLKIGETRIELLEATSPDSPIAQFIERRGEGIHHIALRVDQLPQQLQFLKEHGIKLINEIPKEGAHGNTIAFLHPKSTHGVLLELCQPGPETDPS